MSKKQELNPHAYSPEAAVRPGVRLPPSPQVELVERAQEDAQAQVLQAPREWDTSVPEAGLYVVEAAAGTGKTAFLIDTVVACLERGVAPDEVVVLGASKEAAADLREEIARRVTDYVAAGTMVCSVHSLAFALLRQARGEELRLITGAEQDAVIRELLSGHVEAGAQAWPEYIRPAVGLLGFARQLRDFILRAHERGLGPEEVEALGRTHNREMWTAAGAFMREYEQVMALSGSASLSAAELVNEVTRDPSTMEGHGWKVVIVDDAQLLDPKSAAVVQLLLPAAELAVIAGDPDQAVFGFRGANADFVRGLAGTRIGGREVQRIALETPRRRPEPVCVDIVRDPATQRAVIADLVRRRHLEDGVPWADIAVIVRGGGEIGAVRRTLLAAGVPVHINPTDVVLSEQRLVHALLQAVRFLYERLEDAELEELLTGPVGGADPVSLRRLIRGLRRESLHVRGIDSLREVLANGVSESLAAKLTPREKAIVDRLRGILEAGRAARENGTIEDILWAVWSETGLAARLQAAALRGGATGSQADRDLDAVMALFDAAGDYAERYPEADIVAFINFMQSQELPTGVRDRRTAAPEAVEVVSAHGAVGREWDTVIVVGAQEGSWPSLGETGSIFAMADLVDLVDHGIDPSIPVSHVAERLGEERRLFHVATTRHLRRAAIVAINAPDGERVYEPSRFIGEFVGRGVDLPGVQARAAARREAQRVRWIQELGLQLPAEAIAGPSELDYDDTDVHTSVLSVPAFVAQLRRVVLDDSEPKTRRAQARRQLARLAQAGVPGAHPDEWWGAREVASLSPADKSAWVSPSAVDKLLQCPLQAIFSKLGLEEETTLNLVRGNMAHAFLEAIGTGAEVETAAAVTRAAYAEMVDVPPWQQEHELADFAQLLERIARWLENSRATFETVAVEAPVRVELDNGVTINGFIDRLEKSGEDYFVVDLKTGKNAPPQAEVDSHAQLATYQLALRHGQFDREAGVVRTGPGLPVGGGVLVFPRVERAEVLTRTQACLGEEELQEFAAQLPLLVQERRGPHVTARENTKCDECQFRNICPIQPEGVLTHAADS